MSDDLIIGCPVYKRAWVLSAWFDHADKAAANAGVNPVYAFVVDDRDQETLEVIAAHDTRSFTINVPEPLEHSGERVWNHSRYDWMLHLRNELLGMVRVANPHLFLSLDSDILLHPDAIKNLMETIEDCDAVGGKTYMTHRGTSCPSWANIGRDGGLRRTESVGVHPVQVIMAIKMMKPTAYAVDYEFSRQGEDIGWSLACAKRGLKIMWDGRVANKHVMFPAQMDRVDSRVGF